MSTLSDLGQQVGRRLKLRDLHVFFTVAQCGSMAKAATHLGVSQPAVSQVIADLEHRLGVPLLDRSPRGVELTDYGRALLNGGALAFDNLKQTISEIEFLADPTKGQTWVGCPETISILLSPIIQRLILRYPGIVIHTSDVNAPTLDLPQVRDRTLDLAIVRIAGPVSGHMFGDDLNVEVLINDETMIVVGQSSPWARRRKVDIAELVNEPWILPPRETLNSKLLMAAFRNAGLQPPKINLVTFSVQLRINLLADGPYVTVLPRSMMRLYGSRLPLKVLPVKLAPHIWPLVMVTLKNRTLNPTARLFIQHLREGAKLFAPQDIS